ncbi:MAG: WhiB family transcriptional regulator [Gammaproteobacteria bacterium]|nr:WhiB family transcriptional regulator [Gammaproteobacteria bacterium]
MEPGVFFPGEDVSSERALAVCGGCPVRDECLSYAFEFHMTSGIWGGMSAAGRRELRRVGKARRAG